MSPPVGDVGSLVLRIGAALLVGMLVGLERETLRKPAGFRTFALVSLGSCVFVVLALELIEDWRSVASLTLDPIRVVAGLMGGIGFLAAGAIIESRGSVDGITTAASIWVTGALGMACGLGSLQLAGLGVVATLVVLRGLGAIEHRFLHREDRSPGTGPDDDSQGRSRPGPGGSTG